MVSIASWQLALRDLGRAALRWAISWGRLLHVGGLVLALAFSRSSWRGENRAALARQVYLGTAPLLLWFTLLSALISLVLIRIVVVTALSYGLTQYALEMVVRVLVMELIPLTAALFVALRCTIPHGADMARLRSRGALDALRLAGVDPLQREALPRVAGGLFAVLLLAAVSCALTLVLAYVSVYGFTPWGFDSYTRTVGRVFSPAVALNFALKVFLLGLAVALIPVASALAAPRRGSWRGGGELQGLVRMFMAILLIEAVALAGNYY